MTKKILAVLLALAMIFSLCSVEMFAADADTSLLLEIGKVDGTLVQSALQDVTKSGEYTFTASLDAAIPLEGSAFIAVKTVSGDTDQVTKLPEGTEVTVVSVKIDGTDAPVDPAKVTQTVKNGIFNAHDGITLFFGWPGTNAFKDPRPANFKEVTVTVDVKVPGSEETEEPEGTKLDLSKNGTYNWAANVAWENVETSLKDISPDALAKIESIEVSLTVTGAVADGKKIDVSKVGANLVLQGKWSGWHSVEAGTTTDGAFKIVTKPGDYNLAEDGVSTYQLISQLYINPDNLPNGLDGTKAAAVYYKDAKVTINMKAEEPEKGDKDEARSVALITDSKGVTGTSFAGPTVPWGSKAIDSNCAEWAKFKEALEAEDAKFILKYTISGEPTINDEGNEDYGWFNFFGAGGQSVANWAGGAAKFVDVLNGEQQANQWSLLHVGDHVVTYALSDWQAALKEAGASAITDVTFQSGLASTLSVNITSLVVEYTYKAPSGGGMSYPEGYTPSEALKANIETTDEGVVITPEGEVISDDMMIVLKNGAPDEGTVTVYYGEEGTPYYKVSGTVTCAVNSATDELQFKTGWGSAASKVTVDSLAIVNADGTETPLEVNVIASTTGEATVFAKAKLPKTISSGELTLKVTGTTTSKDIQYRIYGIFEGKDANTTDIFYFTIADEPTVPEANYTTYETTFRKGAIFITDIKGDPKQPITKIVVKTKTGTVEILDVCVAVEDDKDDMTFNGYAIQIGSSQYHGYRVGPFMIPMPHNYYNGMCLSCGQKAPEEEPLVEAEEEEEEAAPVYTVSADADYVLEKTAGQDYEDYTIAGGAALVTSDGRTRLATSWVGGGEVYNALVDALNKYTDDVIKITYTGTITAFGIESENGGIIDMEYEVTEGDEYNTIVMTVADFLEAGKPALDDSSWRNIYLVAEDGAVLYGFEIIAAE